MGYGRRKRALKSAKKRFSQANNAIKNTVDRLRGVTTKSNITVRNHPLPQTEAYVDGALRRFSLY